MKVEEVAKTPTTKTPVDDVKLTFTITNTIKVSFFDDFDPPFTGHTTEELVAYIRKMADQDAGSVEEWVWECELIEPHSESFELDVEVIPGFQAILPGTSKKS